MHKYLNWPMGHKHVIVLWLLCEVESLTEYTMRSMKHGTELHEKCRN